jgi:hypothetical protein
MRRPKVLRIHRPLNTATAAALVVIDPSVDWSLCTVTVSMGMDKDARLIVVTPVDMHALHVWCDPLNPAKSMATEANVETRAWAAWLLTDKHFVQQVRRLTGSLRTRLRRLGRVFVKKEDKP